MRKRQLEETKREKAPKKDEPDDRPARTRPKAARDVEELLITPDAAGQPPPHRPVRRKGKHEDSEFFESPVPDHRHLGAAALGSVDEDRGGGAALLPDRAETVTAGNGNTMPSSSACRRRARPMRPTNVGAVNLHARCVTRFPDETALAMPPSASASRS